MLKEYLYNGKFCAHDLYMGTITPMMGSAISDCKLGVYFVMVSCPMLY